VGHLQRRLIAFDLDGTLIDSSRDLADSVNQLLVEFGARELPRDAITRMVGEGARVLVRRALVASGVPETPEAIGRFLDIYDTRLLDHTRPYDGVLDVVRAAREHARVAVLTNKPTAPTEKILAGLGNARPVRRCDWQRRTLPAETGPRGTARADGAGGCDIGDDDDGW